MRVVDADDHLIRTGVADESVDHLTHPAQWIWTEVPSDVGERAQGDAARRCRADDPVAAGITAAMAGDGFACDPRLADTSGAGQHDPAGAVGGRPHGIGDYLKLLGSPDQGPLADHRQILTGTSVPLRGSIKRTGVELG
jgi:hypothetical protein